MYQMDQKDIENVDKTFNQLKYIFCLQITV